MRDDLLKDYSGARSTSRNGTARSELCETIVLTFIRNKATAAAVIWERTNYSRDELYRGLYNICKKTCYRRLVRVSLRDGKLILKRLG